MPTESAPTKTCPQCLEVWALEDFGTQSSCRPCRASYARSRYVPSPRVGPSAEEILENARARSRRYYHRHKDRYERYRADNREAVAERKKRYQQAHLHLWALDSRKRYARKKGAVSVENIDPLIVLELDDGVCGICGGDVDPAKFDVDHVIPLSRGGQHVLTNLQASHPICNRRKHNRLPGEYLNGD